jgi:hypothetical protein
MVLSGVVEFDDVFTIFVLISGMSFQARRSVKVVSRE